MVPFEAFSIEAPQSSIAFCSGCDGGTQCERRSSKVLSCADARRPRTTPGRAPSAMARMCHEYPPCWPRIRVAPIVGLAANTSRRPTARDNCRSCSSPARNSRESVLARSRRIWPLTAPWDAERNDRLDLGPLPELIGYVLRRAQLVVFQDFFAAFAPFDISPGAVLRADRDRAQSGADAEPGRARRSASSAPISSACSTSWRGAGSPSGGRPRATSAPMRSTSRGRRDLMRKLKPVLKAHESRMVAKVGEEGRDRLIELLHEIADSGATRATARTSRERKLLDHLGRDRLRPDLGRIGRIAPGPHPGLETFDAALRPSSGDA